MPWVAFCVSSERRHTLWQARSEIASQTQKCRSPEKRTCRSCSPTSATADYAALRDAVGQYLSAFRERTPELERSGPKLVYICAPLRGDVTNNVEFARQKAQEVFVEGNIPICPHLLFPPVADPDDPAQDEKARAMGLRLLESCQQMNVYGPVWTDGMWQEIYKAGELGIPVMTDQKTIGRTPPARHPKRKER